MLPSDRPIAMCSHLQEPSHNYLVWFTGRDTECYWVCESCAKSFPELPGSMVDTTDQLLKHCSDDHCWEGICGTPASKQRESTIRFSHEDFAIGVPHDDRIIDIQPDSKEADKWLILLASGTLCEANFRLGKLTSLFTICEPDFEIDDETALLVSNEKDYAAIYMVSKPHAVVLDLKSGAVTTRISRGLYRPENSHFPIAFFQINDQTLLVAATDWNRLDIIDPSDGKVLTKRSPTSYKKGEERPPHYLDYFHGQLLVSPAATWIADNGWVWMPVGIVRTWNLRKWLEENPWESEDGDSKNGLVQRLYYWDGPLCWINDSTLAIWGWGDDSDWLIPAVRLFDVTTANELSWFPGPEARQWPRKKIKQSLFFDDYLFAADDEKGISVWDITTGERLHHDQSTAPILYHRVNKEFLTQTADYIRLSRLVHD